MENHKKMGTIYEVQFRMDALKQGFDVFNPEGDYSLVDAIVLNQVGKSFRVQVKGTSKRSDVDLGRTTKYKCIMHAAKEDATAKEVDVLACYIAPKNTWYLLPMTRAIGRQSFVFFPSKDSKSQWEPYRNNWDIFLE